MKTLKAIVFLFFAALLLRSQCVPVDTTGCTGYLAAGGDQAGTVPLITCPAGYYDVAYSTMGNSAARHADVCFIKSLSNSDSTKPICVSIHGGGDSAGDQHGDFSMANPAGWFVAIELGACSTMVSLNYTLYANSKGTSAPYPAPIQDILCGLHWIGHNAGVNFPGNPMDIRLMAFSWGSQLSMLAAWNPGGYSPVCEYTDAYSIRGPNAVTGVAYDWTAQWPSQADSVYLTAMTAGAWGACSGAACLSAMAPYDNYNFIGVGKSQFVMLEGATDTTTNPTYQGGSAVVQFAALGVPLQRQLTPGVGHGSSCKNALFVPTECWKLAVEVVRDTKSSIASGSAMASGYSGGW